MTVTTEGPLGDRARTDQMALDAVHSAERRDLVFAASGLVIMAVAMTLLLSLIGDLILRGLPRIDADFKTSFPSRLPERAGILSAWVGSLLVMLVTAFLSIPIGVLAGPFPEEYAR